MEIKLNTIHFTFLILVCTVEQLNAQFGDNENNGRPNTLFSTDPNDIQFYLFSDKSKPNRKTEILYDNAFSLRNAKIVPNATIYMYVHGFSTNVSTGGCLKLKDAYFKRNFTNIICINWGKLAGINTSYLVASNLLSSFLYNRVIRNTIVVGKRIADFLSFLVAHNAVPDMTYVHLVGHSIGSHVVGTAGAQVFKNTGKKIGIITALDPAGPLYEAVPLRYKLDETNAVYVEVMHTDITRFGTPNSMGHSDFFVNGGRGKDQAGCPQGLLAFFNPKFTFAFVLYCPHVLSIDYYERAILGEPFFGCECGRNSDVIVVSPSRSPSCLKPKECRKTQQFGPYAVETGNGNFYLSVPQLPPANILPEYVSLVEKSML